MERIPVIGRNQDLLSVFYEAADGWRAGFETENQAIASNDLFLLQSVGTQKWFDPVNLDAKRP